MYLAYFDEVKYEVGKSPFFYIGGIIVDEKKSSHFESDIAQIQRNFFGTSILSRDTELHGSEAFNGKANFKKRSLEQKVELFKNIGKAIIINEVAIRIVKIDVLSHRSKYNFPEPHYQLGLTLFLERICDFLEEKGSLGIAFGDYEQDEIAKSILDFSQIKQDGKTFGPLGRPLVNLIDTIYMTHSHFSRFLQVADMVCYMAQRYESDNDRTGKWLDNEVGGIWTELKQNTNFKIQCWPK